MICLEFFAFLVIAISACTILKTWCKPTHMLLQSHGSFKYLSNQTEPFKLLIHQMHPFTTCVHFLYINLLQFCFAFSSSIISRSAIAILIISIPHLNKTHLTMSIVDVGGVNSSQDHFRLHFCRFYQSHQRFSYLAYLSMVLIRLCTLFHNCL